MATIPGIARFIKPNRVNFYSRKQKLYYNLRFINFGEPNIVIRGYEFEFDRNGYWEVIPDGSPSEGAFTGTIWEALNSDLITDEMKDLIILNLDLF